MNQELIIGIVLASVAAFALGWPVLKKVWPTISSGFSGRGGDPKSTARDDAIGAVLKSIDYAHENGRHDLCDSLAATLPDLAQCGHERPQVPRP